MVESESEALSRAPSQESTASAQRAIAAALARGHRRRGRILSAMHAEPALSAVGRTGLYDGAGTAAEDIGFYDHGGIDWAELRKIWTEDRKRGRLRGGSTISQQLVKNLFLTTHRSVIRKALEFTLVPIAEGVLSKDRILELYLNVIEWGPGVYGLEAAAQYHYGVPAAVLTREQAARLAACIPAPRTRKPDQMSSYSQEILRRMKLRGW